MMLLCISMKYSSGWLAAAGGGGAILVASSNTSAMRRRWQQHNMMATDCWSDECDRRHNHQVRSSETAQETDVGAINGIRSSQSALCTHSNSQRLPRSTAVRQAAALAALLARTSCMDRADRPRHISAAGRQALVGHLGTDPPPPPEAALCPAAACMLPGWSVPQSINNQRRVAAVPEFKLRSTDLRLTGKLF